MTTGSSKKSKKPKQVSTNSTKASVKQTTADKKRKKDEVVTNGRGSNKSPPPKKRIEDNCEKDEVSTTPKNASPGIGTFFRSITKKEFIADNEKTASLTVVKAMVHSPGSGDISGIPPVASKRCR